MSGKTPAGTSIDNYQLLVAVNSLIDSLNLEGMKAPGVHIRDFLKYQSAFSSVEINDTFNFCFLLYNHHHLGGSTQRIDCCLYKKSEPKFQNKCYFSQSVDCKIDIISDQALKNEIDHITSFSGVYLASKEMSLILWQSSNPISEIEKLKKIL